MTSLTFNSTSILSESIHKFNMHYLYLCMRINDWPSCVEDFSTEISEWFPSAEAVLSWTLVSSTLSTNNPLLVFKEARNVPCNIEDSRRAIRCSDVVPSKTRTLYVTLTPDSKDRLLFWLIKSSSTETSCTSSTWAIVFVKALRKECVVVCVWVRPLIF